LTRIDDSWSLPSGNHYCRLCISFGRVEENQHLYYFLPKAFDKQHHLTWEGKLTPNQNEVSRELIEHYREAKNTLVYAVTGAGKTEMIYQLISNVLSEGKWVCIASPRIDVCIELEKRLARDFSCPVLLLYGETESYERTPLIIATTHQLMKFYRAFDLLIIDEVDSFPYVDNQLLNQASKNALAINGHLVLLTATSTQKLERLVNQKKLHKICLSRRFHNNPLVVPNFLYIKKLNHFLRNQKIPKKLKKLFMVQRKTRFPLLVFYPIIHEGEMFSKILSELLPNETIGFVSSLSDSRNEIVEKFRNQDITILVTTTILERGVTFPCVDVFVILSNHKLFNSSSLIQISGRVGRAMERTSGQLLFIHEGVSVAMKQAKKEIEKMNRKAGF